MLEGLVGSLLQRAGKCDALLLDMGIMAAGMDHNSHNVASQQWHALDCSIRGVTQRMADLHASPPCTPPAHGYVQWHGQHSPCRHWCWRHSCSLGRDEVYSGVHDQCLINWLCIFIYQLYTGAT